MTRHVSYPSPQLRADAAPTRSRREDCTRGTTWPDHEIEYLKLHYGRFPVKFIAEHLRRSPLAIRIQVCRMRKRGATHGIESLRNVSRLTVEAAE